MWITRERGTTRLEEGLGGENAEENQHSGGMERSRMLKSFTSGHRGEYWGAGWAREWGAFIIIGSYLHPMLNLTSL